MTVWLDQAEGPVRCKVWCVRCEVRGVMCGVSLCLLMLVWTGSNQDMRILAWWEGCLLHWCCLYWLLYISCTQHSHCTAITWPDVLISQSMIQAVVVCSPTQVHWHFLLLHMIADCSVSCRVMTNTLSPFHNLSMELECEETSGRNMKEVSILILTNWIG